MLSGNNNKSNLISMPYLTNINNLCGDDVYFTHGNC